MPPARPWGVRRTALRRALVLAGSLLALVVVGAGPAAAHDALTGSDPADGATVPVAPEQVRLDFSDAPAALGTEVRVTGPDGTVVSVGEPTLDALAVVQTLAAYRPAGTYTVDWRVTSADGHPVSGTLTFVAAEAAGAPPTPTPSPTPTPTSTPTPTPTPTSAATATASTDPAEPSPSPTPSEGTSSGARSSWPVIGGALLIAAAAAVAVALARRRGQDPGAPSGPGQPQP